MGKTFPCFTFLGLSFGDCKDTVTTKTIQKSQTDICNEVISSLTKSTVVNNKATAINSVAIRIVGQRDVIVDGLIIKQFAQAKLISSTEIAEKITQDTTLNTLVDKMMAEFVKISSKSAGAQREILSESEQQISTIIKNKIKTEMRVDTVATCIASAVNSASIDIEANNVTIRAINIEQTAQASAECITKIVSDVVSKIEIPTDVRQKFQREDNVKLESSWSNLLYIIAAIVAAFIVIFVIIIMVRMRQSAIGV